MRIRKEALQHIKNEYDAGRLGAGDYNGEGCIYETEDGSRHCAVGCLLTSDQIAELRSKDMMSSCIITVADELGESIIVRTTGMDVDELVYMQGLHDRMSDFIINGDKGTALYEYLQTELEKA